MSSLSKFSDFITSPVGNALKNLPEDVQKVKQNFKALGIFDEDTENGYMTHGLDSAIKTFQRDNGLKVDGRINPRGETENRIFDVLAGGLTDKTNNKGQSKVINNLPRRTAGIGFGTSLTDFKIKRDGDTPTTKNKGYNEKEYLDEVENTYREYVKIQALLNPAVTLKHVGLVIRFLLTGLWL